MEWLSKLPAEFIYVAIAAGGGMAKYLHGYLLEGKFAFRHLVAHTFISAFSGFMFYQFGSHVLPSPSIMPIFAGLGGWMGVSALELAEVWMRKKLNK